MSRTRQFPPERQRQWQDRAACLGMETASFFPESGQTTSEAKAACARCPVAGPCLEYAMAGRERGTWAGTSEPDRLSLALARWIATAERGGAAA
jgi:WhiB family transcriptional regulator, redox-sensing transcriptional regulator